jgi:hypothetical protein
MILYPVIKKYMGVEVGKALACVSRGPVLVAQGFGRHDRGHKACLAMLEIKIHCSQDILFSELRKLSNKRRRYSVVLAATRVEALSGDGDGHESEKRRRRIDDGRNGSSIEKFDCKSPYPH